MPKQTFPKAFADLAAELKKRVVTYSLDFPDQPPTVVSEPDPAYDGLRALVWEHCPCYRGNPCPSFILRTDHWLTDKGAWEGALAKALKEIWRHERDVQKSDACWHLAHDIHTLYWDNGGDTRIPATQAVTKWLREQA